MGTFAKIVATYLVICIAADAVVRIKQNTRNNRR